MPDIVLVTGATSGIGAACALALSQDGATVYATGRDLDRLQPLQDRNLHILELDVTDEESMQAAIDTVLSREGRIDVLVNNAGYGQYGALEALDMADLRRQFETNLFGLMRLTQFVLPGMRANKRGRIINVSSMAANFSMPGGGAYYATKHALNALSDALRYEVSGFGINVVVIEPGMIRTAFADTVRRSLVRDGRTDAYVDFDRRMARALEKLYTKGLSARFVGSPEDVADVVLRAATARRPRTRYRVTLGAHLLVGMRRILPDRLWDGAMRLIFPDPPTS